MSKDLFIIILAAGKGTRMRSTLPKVLHPLAGMSLLEHVIHSAKSLSPKEVVVVYGHGGELVPTTLSSLEVTWAEQSEQLGTGHAVMTAMPHVPDHATVLILYGDVPLTSPTTLATLLKSQSPEKPCISLLTATLDDPTGYGRIIRDGNQHVTHIVEQKDANESELEVREVNTGILAAPSELMRKWLSNLSNDNAQGEYYLTDVIAMAASEDIPISTSSALSVWEMLGVNDKIQLSTLERHYQLQQAKHLMTEGVTLRDPARVDVRGALNTGKDVVVDVNCVFEGIVNLGDGCNIGANCFIKDATIGENVEIRPNTVIENATIGAGSVIGPFARLRPDTELADDVHIGNFVEVKKSKIDAGSKVNHLSYVGDALVGKRVNIGAGTITCNYDGANKHVTEIGDDVFVGSDTQLVAPVKLGNGSTIGAGSTITRDAPENELTLSRTRQTTVTGWKRPRKNSIKD